ncbi:MAG: DNA polymerase III subunit [Kiritimatiellaeota bacterium]|nr:DNA polymerase III subunit [Kiritimatiellota bacterium]
MQLPAAIDFITQAFKNGRMAHAYLVTGETETCVAFAERALQAINCPDAGCGACNTCRLVRERLWMDAAWVFPEKKSRVISVEQMRGQVIARVSQTSLAGGWKAAVIVGADRLNESAANVFLKTLEEPPPETLFLLLTDTPQSLLPTVVSRCQRIDLPLSRRLGEPWRAKLLEVLARDTVDGPLGGMVLGAGILELLKEAKALAESGVDEENNARTKIELDDATLDALASARYRETRGRILAGVQDWWRDILVMQTCGDTALLAYPEHAERLAASAKKSTRAQALAGVEGVESMNRQLERSLPEEGVLTYWMDRVGSGV